MNNQDNPNAAGANPVSRRGLIRGLTALAMAGTAGSSLAQAGPTQSITNAQEGKAAAKGRIKQSVCRWCYGGLSLDDLCAAVAKLGLQGIDLCGPNEFPTLQKHGLICTMVSGPSLHNGICDPDHWATSIEAINRAIKAAAEAGYPNVICFSGNARGIDKKKGMDNCAQALKEIIPLAEDKGVTVCMELLNSRVDHGDYMCDQSAWGVELCKRVASDRFRLLYDIYHMQIMEGDLIRTIERDHEFFAHYHTAGNPGRHEMDETQEMFYPAIIRAIIDTGFQGFLGQEFIPTRDPLTSLGEMVRLCDV